MNHRHRHDSDSDTTSTENDDSWGGLGKFEYSQKGLPHALMHYTELIMRAGHHGAACTSVVEAAHKLFIKAASRFSRTYASKTRSEEAMLEYVQRQSLYTEVVTRVQGRESGVDHQVRHSDASDESETVAKKKLTNRVPYTEGWHNLPCPGQKIPRAWGHTFMSNKIRLTRLEFLYGLAAALNLQDIQDEPDHKVFVRMLTHLHFDCFGILDMESDGRARRLVGISSISRKRRDFVRILTETDQISTVTTCRSAQILMFVKISGFTDSGDGVQLHDSLRIPSDNHSEVVLTMIRWLSPHQNAIVRDKANRPLCTSPFDMNHALWKFAERDRTLVTPTIMGKHVTCYEGANVAEQVRHMHKENKAWFDFVQPESLDIILNCTSINDDPNTIMETITLPF